MEDFELVLKHDDAEVEDGLFVSNDLKKVSGGLWELPEGKLLHMRNVAQKMYVLSHLHRAVFGIDPRVAYFLGYIHDIGYAFSENVFMHDRVGGDLLYSVGSFYHSILFNHGRGDFDSSSIPNGVVLDLLNYCDLTVDSMGRSCTVDSRIDDVKKRYSGDALDAVVSNLRRLSEKVKWIGDLELKDREAGLLL